MIYLGYKVIHVFSKGRLGKRHKVMSNFLSKEHQRHS